MPDKQPSVKNEKQYEALKDKGMSKERAAKIANSPQASKHVPLGEGQVVPGRDDGAEEGRRPQGRAGDSAQALVSAARGRSVQLVRA